MNFVELIDILKAEYKGKDYVISWDVAWDINILLSEGDDFDKASKSISESATSIITQFENLPEISISIRQAIATPTQIKTKETVMILTNEV